MAQIHNALTRHTQLLRGIRSIFGFGQSDGGIERLSESLGVVLDPWQQPENLAPIGDTLWAYAHTIGATVGEYSGVAVLNPSASGRLIIVEGAYANCGTATSRYRESIATTTVITGTYAFVSVPTLRDRRAPAPLGMIYAGADAVLMPSAAGEMVGLTSVQVVANVPPVVLYPGYGYVIQSQTVNLGIVAGFRCREHPMQPGEQML